MNPILEALQFRYAAKAFDPEKTIPGETLDTILECARLSPTSFGMEAWKFLVVASKEVKEKLQPACWNQPKVTQASHIIVLLTTPDMIQPGSAYVSDKFHERGLPEEATKAYIERYKTYMDSEVFPRMSGYAWCAKQCYIALANIMTAAAAEAIDSCPMEGFEKDQVEKVLGINTAAYEVAVMVALGYRIDPQPPRHRKPFDTLFEFI